MQGGERGADLRMRATAAHQSGDLETAYRGYLSYLARVPGDAGIWSNLGVLFRVRGQHEMAQRAQERALALAPDDDGMRGNLANILSDTGDYDRSIALRRELLNRRPSELMQMAMIGRCLRGQGRYEEAIAWLAPRAEAHPEEPELRLQLAFALLGAGQYGAGFDAYDARWDCGELTRREMPYPRWRPGIDIAGKRVLVVPEQGFGDGVLMARFLAELAKRGARVWFLTEKPLARLFSGLDGAEWVGTALAAETGIDCWMSVFDLPRLVWGPDETGPPPAPARLTVPPDARQRARAITAPFGDRYKVGVVWSGSATYKGNAFRSFSHADYLPLAELADVQLFSLYKGPFLDAYIADGSAAFMIDAAGTDRDFADCAATMEEMDLIITSDTATAHIAGSLGREVWTVLHWDPFWVYRHAGDGTEWYPTMRLFRQTEPRNWAPVFAEIRAELETKIAEWRSG